MIPKRSKALVLKVYMGKTCLFTEILKHQLLGLWGLHHLPQSNLVPRCIILDPGYTHTRLGKTKEVRKINFPLFVLFLSFVPLAL